MAGNSVVINVIGRVQGLTQVEAFKAKLNGLTTSKGFKQAALGFGLSAGNAAWNALGASIDGAIAYMGDAAKAAAADEASQAKLYTAITENARAWDGNRDAIERVLQTRMR